jgi:EAL domain-containing protein (putative c-di-GMP-specific phosphodiesterase class I)
MMLTTCTVQGLVFGAFVLSGIRRHRPPGARGWYLLASKMGLLTLLNAAVLVRDLDWISPDVGNAAAGVFALTGIGVAATAYAVFSTESYFGSDRRLLRLWLVIASGFLVAMAWRLAHLISRGEHVGPSTVFDGRSIALALVTGGLPFVSSTVRNIQRRSWAGVALASYPLTLAAAFTPSALGAPVRLAATTAMVGISFAHALVAAASLHPSMIEVARTPNRTSIEVSLVPAIWIIGFNLLAAPLVMSASRHAWMVPAYTVTLGCLFMRRVMRRSSVTTRHHALATTVGDDARAGADASSGPDRALGQDLKAALSESALAMHYQPIVNLNNGAVVGVEALLRWQHPVKRWIPPEEVLALARRCGLDADLDDWIMSTVLRDAVQLHDAMGGPRSYVAVNITPAQLVAPGFTQAVGRRLADAGVDANCMVLEITEHESFGDLDQVGLAIRHLRQLGVRVAIDDFGAGNANLALLAALDIDLVKLDRALVAGFHAVRGKRVLGRTVDMLRVLGLDVVVEGIEDVRLVEQLIAMNISVAQGYGLGGPLALGDMLTDLSQRRLPDLSLVFASGESAL